MAQPSESSQSRPQPLDPSSVKSHAPLGNEHQQQQDQQEDYHHQQHTLQREEAPQQRYTNVSASKDCTHSFASGARHGLGGGDEEDTSDGGSAAHAYPNNRASIDGPAETIDGLDAGRHETRYSGDTPLLASPPMSNAQHPQGPHRQQVNYPSPTSYPPAGLPTAHYAFPSQPAPPPDHYRQTATALPSMRTLDHQQQQHQHQHTMAMAGHMAGPMAPGPPMGYYSVPPHAYSIHADPNAMRFAIAPGMADPRIALSGGRHKKEIKRRTKTGCLTCRKRRIKCDEAHPTCNNCKKSKRECLGYDPIFKQQQGPAAIQPAPNNNQASAVITTLASAPTLPSSNNHPYQQQPPIVPSSYPPSVPSSITFDSPVSSTPQSVKTESGFDYSAAIDPALQGADLSSGAGTPASQYQQLKLEGTDQGAGFPSAYKSFPAKKMKVDELIALGGAAPPTPSSPPSAHDVDESARLYHEVYARGLTLFFETKWYEPKSGQTGAPNPILVLRNNPQSTAVFTSFLHNIVDIRSTDPADLVYSSHLETCVVWALASLPFSCALQDMAQRPTDFLPTEDDTLEARNRVYVFETLVSGKTLPSNPLSMPTTNNISTARKHELEFWYHLAQYLLEAHSSLSPSDTAVRENYLGLMRSLLNGRENRDVLYSIAVLREYTAHWDAALNEQTVPSHLEESDPRSKLAVATRFIRDESASTGGTTNVVRRFADIAYRAFVRPGINVNTKGGRG
ncbi:hypothetical protein B0T25DRAFT_455700 [Lasiosphaeria hispida]|uniref:Zn(2)-C6 fungal-type domain-containing protein n=1 Tax=Lasiosphaeria hispida TaxID=260671 RepID=A0AAJ0HHK8_9PEZI|nr:hypothetical protein B0T25DRAFT_455700 [Lasiosphaeria hispida]